MRDLLETWLDSLAETGRLGEVIEAWRDFLAKVSLALDLLDDLNLALLGAVFGMAFASVAVSEALWLGEQRGTGQALAYLFGVAMLFGAAALPSLRRSQ